MIVRESKDAFTLITQHDHATISGEFFLHFKKDFISAEHYESLSFAIFQHDRAWLVPDAAPIWNDYLKRPYDFTDYPEELKVYFYKHGIEQVDRVNSYSALLCSLHYSSFFKNALSEAGRSFYQREVQRQKHLMHKLKIKNEFIQYQLQVLKFCDDLSLYVCLNRPGVPKSEEISMFKKGFENSELFNDKADAKIIASFSDRNALQFNYSPFVEKFDIKIPSKVMLKADIEKFGLLNVYQGLPLTYTTLKINK
ncbi:DUF3891 family protein [Pseudopedobacter beijingensis]|uniref:DUF3891 family protein n=1 Tax=Pseudopedobacter beijingensis TaxID=1207056 RepID=A0ABW4IGA8_9SPHI